MQVGTWVSLPVIVSGATSAGWGALAAVLNQTGAQADGGIHLVLQSSLGPLARAADQMLALLRPDGGTPPGAAFTVLDTPLLRTAGLIVVVASLGACLVAWVGRMDADPRGVLVLRAVALTIPVSAVMLVAIFWITYQGVHSTASRFALPFLAAASVGLGTTVRRSAATPVALVGIAVWLAAWVGIVG